MFEIAISISLLITAIGFSIAIYNVSIGLRRKYEVHEVQKIEHVDQNNILRSELNKQLDLIQQARFGKQLIPTTTPKSPDGTVMGGNPNAARIVAAKQNKEKLKIKNGIGTGNKG